MSLLKDEHLLLKAIREGDAVLFLGAGASAGAKDSQDKAAPVGSDLAERIAAKFFPTYKDAAKANLSRLGNWLESEGYVPEMQSFIKDELSELLPSSGQQFISKFRWYGIVTINYDDLIEKSYKDNKMSKQSLIPILNDDYRVHNLIRDRVNQVPYLKMHGCITHYLDTSAPFVISTKSFFKAPINRKILFDEFLEYLASKHIIFVGTSMADPDINAILEAAESFKNRKRHYIIDPYILDMDQKSFESLGFRCFKMTFDQFMAELDNLIPDSHKNIAGVVKIGHPIENYISSHEKPTEDLLEFLTYDSKLVDDTTLYSAHHKRYTAQNFYRGEDQEWFPILNNLDIERRVSEKIMDFINGPTENLTNLVVLHGSAGDGKSILLKRLAWKIFKSDKLCLFIGKGKIISSQDILELYKLVNQRIYIMIDDLTSYSQSILDLLEECRKNKILITIIGCARTNERNEFLGDLRNYINREFLLERLDYKEIEELVDLLDKNDSLGSLSTVDKNSRVKYIQQVSKKVLLVLLYEVTSEGKNFDEIIIDEYRRINEDNARRLYLGICALNMFGVDVRAGLINRAFGISFEDFTERFFEPLERVISYSMDEQLKDVLYKSRHPYIAKKVFEQALRHPKSRLDFLSPIMSLLNLGYASDDEAFKKMTNYKSVIDIFGDNKQEARSFYSSALDKSEGNYHIVHHQGLYEMRAYPPQLDIAEACFEQALNMSNNNKFVMHSMATLKQRQANKSEDAGGRELLRLESDDYALAASRASKLDANPLYTRILNSLSRLQEVINKPNTPESEIVLKRKDADNLISQGLRSFPSKSDFYIARSKFYRIIGDQEGEENSMKEAYNKNHTNEYVSIDYARLLVSRGKTTEALHILTKTISLEMGYQDANYEIAQILKRVEGSDVSTVAKHLRDSFTKGDTMLNRQYDYAKWIIEHKDLNRFREGIDILDGIRRSNNKSHNIGRIRDVIKDQDGEMIFSGRIIKSNNDYGFIRDDYYGIDVYFSKDDFKSKMRIGEQISYKIGLRYSGMIAISTD